MDESPDTSDWTIAESGVSSRNAEATEHGGMLPAPSAGRRSMSLPEPNGFAQAAADASASAERAAAHERGAGRADGTNFVALPLVLVLDTEGAQDESKQLMRTMELYARHMEKKIGGGISKSTPVVPLSEVGMTVLAEILDAGMQHEATNVPGTVTEGTPRVAASQIVQQHLPTLPTSEGADGMDVEEDENQIEYGLSILTEDDWSPGSISVDARTVRVERPKGSDTAQCRARIAAEAPLTETRSATDQYGVGERAAGGRSMSERLEVLMEALGSLEHAGVGGDVPSLDHGSANGERPVADGEHGVATWVPSSTEAHVASERPVATHSRRHDAEAASVRIGSPEQASGRAMPERDGALPINATDLSDLPHLQHVFAYHQNDMTLRCRFCRTKARKGKPAFLKAHGEYQFQMRYDDTLYVPAPLQDAASRRRMTIADKMATFRALVDVMREHERENVHQESLTAYYQAELGSDLRDLAELLSFDGPQ